MDKQKKEQFTLLIAVAIFIILLLVSFLKNKAESSIRKPQAPLGHSQPAPVEAAAAGNEQAAEPSVAPSADAQTDSPDPFDMPTSFMEKLIAEKKLAEDAYDYDEGANLPNVSLQGVVWGIDSPIAFVDGKAYKKGDMVGGFQIIDIDRKGVYFLYNGDKVLVKIKKQA